MTKRGRKRGRPRKIRDPNNPQTFPKRGRPKTKGRGRPRKTQENQEDVSEENQLYYTPINAQTRQNMKKILLPRLEEVSEETKLNDNVEVNEMMIKTMNNSILNCSLLIVN